jgi:transitional endoplasmic reticulum ATPase
MAIDKHDDNKDKKIYVKVAEPNSKDVGKRIAHLDPKIAEEYNIDTGDALEISSEKAKVVVLNWPAYKQDSGKGLIRIDGYTRKKLEVDINDKVEIRKTEIAKAKSIVLAPTEPLRIRGAAWFISRILINQTVTKGDIVPIGIMGQAIHLIVVSTNPQKDSLLVTDQTKIAVSDEIVQESLEKDVPPLIYENVGGLKEEIRKIKEMIELPLRHPELFKRLGVEAPKGVLLHGPSGTGKTLLAKAIANETNANFYSLGGPEIMSKFYGESEERLRSIFHDADKNAPSIIFIDEIDSIASKREEVIGEVDKRIVSQLLSLMDGLSARGKVVVIGATNRVNAIDPALRRPGRFDREIELGVPDRNGRLDILHIHTRLMPLDNDVDLEKIADITHGFVGADLQSLTKEAAMHSLRKVLPDIDLSDDIPAETLQKIIVKMEDFTDVLKEIEPSAMREVFVEIPDVTWNDVGGLDIIKQELLEAVEWPVIYRKLIRKSKIKTPKGIFLYGPPGTGKTLLAKAVANESQANFISIKGPELLSKWVGESEKGIREIFRKARQAAPCIIFFDEIDSIAPIRGGELGDTHITERVISQMLTELDGLEELRGVVVMAATNRPDIVDTALLRPGRFDRLLYIPLPDRGSRLHILQIHTIYMQLAGDVNLLNLADITEGYTGADIALFVSAAALIALEEHISKYPNPEEADKNANDMKLFMKHFEESMQKIRPLSPQELEVYKKTTEQFGNKTRGIRLAGKITEGIG